MLTAVAFKLVIGDALPKVSYSTVMDYYLNGLFSFMLLIAMENVLLFTLFRGGYLPEGWDENWIDLGTFLLFFTAFVIFHVWYAYFVSTASKANKAQLAGLMRATDYAKQVKDAQRAEANAKAEARPLNDRSMGV